MKDPDKMTEAELRRHVKHLLGMIRTLQETVRKLTSKTP